MTAIQQVDVSSDARRRVVVVGLAALVVALAGWWGDQLLADGRILHLGAPPLYAWWRAIGTGAEPSAWWPAVAAAIGLALAVPLWWARVVGHIRWGFVLGGSWLLGLAWPASLAAMRGTSRLVDPLVEERFEYLPLAREIDSPAEFVSGFIDRIAELPTHVRGHPPGAVLAFWGLDKVLPTDAWMAFGVLAIAASAGPAVLIAVRALADEATARRAAVFVGMAPAAIWIATSSDALFTAVIAWAIALAALAVALRGRAAIVAGGGAGVLAGGAVCMSWGAVVLLGPLGVLWVVLIARRRGVEAGVTLAGAAVLPVAMALAGFDWIEGVSAVRGEYLAGVGSVRPWWYFLFSNLAAFLIVIGPAAVGGIATLRRRELWWLVGGAFAGVAIADLSGMSKGEVERIWLPAVPWVVLAASSIRHWRPRAGWAAVTMALGIVLEWRLLTPW